MNKAGELDSDTEHPVLLLVEDDDLLRSHLAERMQETGFEVETAADRPGALAKLHHARPAMPAVALVDLGLPPHPDQPVEGLALIDALAAASPLTKVLVLTGQDEESAAFVAIEHGAFDFIAKPARFDEILASVKRALRFHRHEADLTRAGKPLLSVRVAESEGLKEAADAAQERLVRQVLSSTDFNVAAAARRMGMSREQIYYYLDKFGIQRDRAD